MEGSQKSEYCLRKSSSAYRVRAAMLVQSTSYIAVACTQTFYFSFRSFGKHRRVRERGEHASEANHTRSTDFEEKIEGLWTGYYSGHSRDLELVFLLASRESVIPEVYISQTFVIYFGLGFSCSPYHRGVRKARVNFILKLGKVEIFDFIVWVYEYGPRDVVCRWSIWLSFHLLIFEIRTQNGITCLEEWRVPMLPWRWPGESHCPLICSDQSHHWERHILCRWAGWVPRMKFVACFAVGFEKVCC